METLSSKQPAPKKRRYLLYIIIFIILLLIIWTISSFYIGKEIENKKNDYLTELNSMDFSLLKDKLTKITGKEQLLYFSDFSNYHRGIFSSSAEVNISLKDDKSGEMSPLGTIKLVIQHGPFPSLSSGDFTPALLRAKADVESMALPASQIRFKGNTILSIDFNQGFNQTSFSGVVNVPAFDVDLPDADYKGTITTNGIVFKFNRNDNNLKTGFDISPLTLAMDLYGDDINFHVDKITTTFEGNFDSFLKYGALIGKNNLNINGMNFMKGTVPVFSIKHINTEDLSLKDDQNMLSGQGSFILDDISFLNAKFGQMKSDISYSNFDLNSLLALSKFNNSEITDDLVNIILTQLNIFLSKNPTLSISNLTWQNDNGVSKNQFGITLQAIDKNALSHILYNPQAAIGSTIKKANLNVTIPKVMVVKLMNQISNNAIASMQTGADNTSAIPATTEKQSAAQLDQLIQIANGVVKGIVEEDNMIKSDINFENSIIDFNGQKINLFAPQH